MPLTAIDMALPLLLRDCYTDSLSFYLSCYAHVPMPLALMHPHFFILKHFEAANFYGGTHKSP